MMKPCSQCDGWDLCLEGGPPSIACRECGYRITASVDGVSLRGLCADWNALWGEERAFRQHEKYVAGRRNDV
jgi:hypothetical protein